MDPPSHFSRRMISLREGDGFHQSSLMCFLRHGLLFVSLLPLPLAGADSRPQAELLTPIGEIRSMSQSAAAEALPVRVRGVVTWRGFRDQMTVQDETGGCWLLVSDARQRRLWATDDAVLRSIRVGHVLEIEGLTDPGSYAPGIQPKTLRIVGEQALLPVATAHYHEWNFRTIGTINFPAAGPQLLTFHYGKGNNFAYFEFELDESLPATKP